MSDRRPVSRVLRPASDRSVARSGDVRGEVDDLEAGIRCVERRIPVENELDVVTGREGREVRSDSEQVRYDLRGTGGGSVKTDADDAELVVVPNLGQKFPTPLYRADRGRPRAA